MATPTDHSAASAETTLELFSVPDKDSLGWSPAEHVVVHLDAKDAIEGFYQPQEAVDASGATVVEFTLSEASAADLLADIDASEAQSFDLANLLGAIENSPEWAIFSDSDMSDSDLGSISPQNEAPQRTVSESDVSQQSFDYGFPQLTILVDDAPEPDTVAL